MKKFEKEDILRNVINAHPKVRFLCYNGNMYYNNTTKEDLTLNKFLSLQTSDEWMVTTDGVIVTELGEAILTENGDYLIIE